MENFLKRITLFIVLCIATIVAGHAQEATPVEELVKEIVKKYEETKGVNCMSVAKGSGLEMVKIMFNKKFGKEFMKGVTTITVIDYSDASQEVCLSLRKDVDEFLTLLQEFNVSKEKEFADNDYIRSFALPSDNGTFSDFVVAVENKESKTIIHMTGDIKVK